MLCPSDRGERVSPRFGPTNYAVLAGSGINGGTPLATDGVFFINSQVAIGEIVDGVSQTVFIGETTLGLAIPVTTPRAELDQQNAYVFASAAPLTQTACDSTNLFNFTDPLGFSWANGEYRSAMFNHFRPPNSSELDCMSAKLIAPLSERYAAYGWRSARSMHPGGVNAARVDGSVRFYAEEIDPALWRALATRHGEEVLTDE
jgi:prepilin-type processing-associated H-X9-DG protein